MMLFILLKIWLYGLQVVPNETPQYREIANFQDFEACLHRMDDTVRIVSFWATWCGPCRTEIPEFEKLHKDYSGKKLKVLLVSLDFPNKAAQSLVPFIRDNHITAPVMLLKDPDANSWIDKVDPAWSGSLPATIIYKGSNRYFFEKAMTYDDLNQIVLLLNP